MNWIELGQFPHIFPSLRSAMPPTNTWLSIFLVFYIYFGCIYRYLVKTNLRIHYILNRNTSKLCGRGTGMTLNTASLLKGTKSPIFGVIILYFKVFLYIFELPVTSKWEVLDLKLSICSRLKNSSENFCVK